MDKSASKSGGDVKAPMPGLVLSVMVEHGQQIKKGDALVVLEAMKMENILMKSPVRTSMYSAIFKTWAAMNEASNILTQNM